MPRGEVPATHLRVGRVIHEDDQEITLTIQKDETRELRIMEGDVFYTMLFLRNDAGKTESWLPWPQSQGGTLEG